MKLWKINSDGENSGNRGMYRGVEPVVLGTLGLDDFQSGTEQIYEINIEKLSDQ